MPIPGRFPTGMKIFQIPLSWFRRVTAWLNNFCGGTGIDVTHPLDPSDVSPVMVSIDREWLAGFIADNLGGGGGAGATPTDASAGGAASEWGTSPVDATNYAAPDTAKWSADSGKPVEIKIPTRLVLGGTSQPSYAAMYCRTLHFSPNGRLTGVSAENTVYRIRKV